MDLPFSLSHKQETLNSFVCCGHTHTHTHNVLLLTDDRTIKNYQWVALYFNLNTV